MAQDVIGDEGDLRTLYGVPSERVRRKVLDHIDGYFRDFIARSPFLVIGTAGPDGAVDVSPRGDPPGFVAVLDPRTLALPDRPGNRRLDTLSNVATGSGVGLVFFIPGFDETLRVNGRAVVTRDGDVLGALAVQERVPRTALLVTVEEAFFHCGKALMRARLWDRDRYVERGVMPSLGRMIADQIGDADAAGAEAAVAESYARRLY